ncbi:hypothetical protein M407DRAFT_236305 [Tulasnella calospora MUT 4182]|uniref:Uncharacterized protein n=1 Tax=Tulasnella calospora MUT 4182 TaxID=1051891 RepID=A0A0C3Q858_9AGAM|nr:hypothetical protein M407DRAFT_236305 [Tulasnella calospora MUT 4182]
MLLLMRYSAPPIVPHCRAGFIGCTRFRERKSAPGSELRVGDNLRTAMVCSEVVGENRWRSKRGWPGPAIFGVPPFAALLLVTSVWVGSCCIAEGILSYMLHFDLGRLLMLLKGREGGAEEEAEAESGIGRAGYGPNLQSTLRLGSSPAFDDEPVARYSSLIVGTFHYRSMSPFLPIRGEVDVLQHQASGGHPSSSEGSWRTMSSTERSLLGSFETVGEVDEVGALREPSNGVGCSSYGMGVACLKPFRPCPESRDRHTAEHFQIA